MRTQDSPASSVLGGPLGHNVFLLVVVDRRNETWLRLLRWSVEGPKMKTVRFGTAGKDDALKGQIACCKSVECIFQHAGVRLNGFSHRTFFDICGEDEIGHLIKRRKSLCRALAVQEIDADVRGSGLSPIGRSGSAGGCGDSPSWVLCDGVDDTCTKDTIGSSNQNLAFRNGDFRDGGHDKISIQIVLTKASTELKSRFVLGEGLPLKRIRFSERSALQAIAWPQQSKSKPTPERLEPRFKSSSVKGPPIC